MQPSDLVGSSSSNSGQPWKPSSSGSGVGPVLVAVLRLVDVGVRDVARRAFRLREAEVAELVALRVLQAGVLAGVEQLAALVEEVADVDHLLDGEPRRARSGHLVRLA